MIADNETPAAALAVIQVDPVEAFRARAEAQALLFKTGELDLHEAVDVLQADAEAGGLVDAIGQDAIQGIIAESVRCECIMTGSKEETEAAWADEGWREVARDYHERRAKLAGGQRESSDVLRARRLLDDSISLDRMWHELNTIKGRAAESTVKALMFSLRERGVRALDESDTRQRLAELNDEQIVEVGTRLKKLTSEIAAAWSIDQVAVLIQTRERLK